MLGFGASFIKRFDGRWLLPPILWGGGRYTTVNWIIICIDQGSSPIWPSLFFIIIQTQWKNPLAVISIIIVVAIKILYMTKQHSCHGLLLGLKRYAQPTIRYDTQYDAHDMIRSAIHLPFLPGKQRLVIPACDQKHCTPPTSTACTVMMRSG